MCTQTFTISPARILNAVLNPSRIFYRENEIVSASTRAHHAKFTRDRAYSDTGTRSDPWCSDQTPQDLTSDRLLRSINFYTIY